MRKKIKEKLLSFLQENYPEIILLFSQKGTLSEYLEDRMALITPLIDELLSQGMETDQVAQFVIADLTKGFGPSRYHYLRMVMEEEFPKEYEQFREAGVLKFELTNMIVACCNAFDAFDFCEENKDDHFLRHMIIAEVHDYLLSGPQN